MQFYVSTDLAIRILRHLSNHSGELQTAETISKAIGTTYHFFIKISRQLRKHGLIVTTRGQRGGFALGKPPYEISVYDVFLAIEGELKLNKCLKVGQRCEHGDSVDCDIYDFMLGLQDNMIKEMSNRYLAEKPSK